MSWLKENMDEEYGEQGFCFSEEELKALECYFEKHPNVIPGEVFYVISEREKFYEYFKNEYPKEISLEDKISRAQKVVAETQKEEVSTLSKEQER